MSAAIHLDTQIKLATGLTRDIKHQAVKLSFDSAADIAEAMSINVSTFIYLLQLSVNSFS